MSDPCLGVETTERNVCSPAYGPGGCRVSPVSRLVEYHCHTRYGLMHGWGWLSIWLGWLAAAVCTYPGPRPA